MVATIAPVNLEQIIDYKSTNMVVIHTAKFGAMLPPLIGIF
jgi:hypothetical protein